MTTAETEASPHATAKQWRTLAGLAKALGARSATHLAALATERTEEDIRKNKLGNREASGIIGTALILANERRRKGED